MIAFTSTYFISLFLSSSNSFRTKYFFYLGTQVFLLLLFVFSSLVTLWVEVSEWLCGA